MKRRANPTLIGAFVVGALAVVFAALLAATGGTLFSRSERAVMHFGGSIYGLQVGAPVVFRGVDIGHVTAIGLVYDEPTGDFSIPVEVELDRDAIRGNGAAVSVATLVAKGLRAQLGLQSLLTGQLYVDLDLRPEREASLRGAPAGLVEIPTSPTAIQNLKAQLDGMDFRRLLDDVSTIATSARDVLGGPELRQALADLQQVAANVRKLTAHLEREAVPLVQRTGRAMADVSDGARKLGAASDRVGMASERVGALIAPDSPLVTRVQVTADELAATAAALRRHTADDAVLVRHLDDALVDLSRAARAVRELATTLDDHPDALLRGRPAADAAPPRR